MDIEIGGNCKYYKCRSLLARDTGGTVYETFKRIDAATLASPQPCSLNGCKDDLVEPASEQTANIIYIVEGESKPGTEKRLTVDSTTHLDDDEFNDYEIHSNNCSLSDARLADSSSGPCNSPARPLASSGCTRCNKHVSPVPPGDNPNRDILQNLVDHILESDDVLVIQDTLRSQRFNHSRNPIRSRDLNDNIGKSKEALLSDEAPSGQSNSDLCYSDCNKYSRQDLVNKYQYEPSMKKGISSKNKHIHKRKQIYNIKDDSFTELLNEEKHFIKKTMKSNNQSRKKISRYNKENQRKKLQHQKRNPFENLKMNSILKGNKKPTVKRSKTHCKLPKAESLPWSDEKLDTNFYISNDDNFGRHNSTFIDEDVLLYKRRSYQSDYCKSFHPKNDVIQEINAIITLSSEFADADYFEYVQPRERIIESDMDKLLSPTIEFEFSEILKTCKIKPIIKDNEEQIDCNGNEFDYYNIKKINNSKSKLSPNEIAETELFLKSAYAKKLGYENYFNTSNESIVNEILFDQSLRYEEIKLDLNLLKHLEMYSKQNSFFDKSFKSISCSLIESLNEFNRFGGFVEEIYKNEVGAKERKTEEDGNDKDNDNNNNNNNNNNNYNNDNEDLHNSYKNSDIALNTNGSDHLFKVNKFQKRREDLILNDDLRKKDDNQINSNFTFNFSNKSNLLSLDFQSKYNSLKYLTNEDVITKPPSTSLKIKIKRINDENNEYIIDDSVGSFSAFNENHIMSKTIKNIYRYKCYNCSAKFRTKHILKNHVSERHKGLYDTECEICHMKYKKSSAHKKHYPWCQKNVTHKCDTCNKVYCYRASLIKHLKTHRKLM